MEKIFQIHKNIKKKSPTIPRLKTITVNILDYFILQVFLYHILFLQN